MPITREIIENATKLRARYNLLTPDAIQISSAMAMQEETIFLTADKGLKKIPDINIVIL